VNINQLNQRQLADRWSVSERTLERWRWQGCGPRYVKVGNRVLYRLEDIEDYENANTHTRTQLEPQPILAGGAPC
jgi:predicted site-specific integrase-resolvase